MRGQDARRTGFTLIELLVVCAIIGILATLALSKIDRAITQARSGQAIANAQSIQTAVHMYMATEGSDLAYPPLLAWTSAASECVDGDGAAKGGINLCPVYKPYLAANDIPKNTLLPAPVVPENFVWSSGAVAATLDAARAGQYPGTTSCGFFFGRRYAHVLLNSNGKFLDGRYYYELGQPWHPAGIAAGATGFGGPWY